MFSEVFRIKDGKSTHKWNSKLGQYLTTLEDGEYECTVQPLEMSKTNDQLALIHVYIKMYSDETGETPFACKLACKEITGYYKVTKNIIRGGTSIDYKSFANASLKELTRIIDEFYTYLTVDMGLNIPSAEEWKNMNAEERSKYR